jgi:hypothetical protein
MITLRIGCIAYNQNHVYIKGAYTIMQSLSTIIYENKS